ncbi:MAG: hypothetical protein HYX60_09160 [Legionella longbeachae]|nr:hypothetical protein [Legionella longbeachae]
MKIKLKSIDTYLDEQHSLLTLLNKNTFHFENNDFYNLICKQIKLLESWKMTIKEPKFYDLVDIIVHFQEPMLDISLEEFITFVSNLNTQDKLMREKTAKNTIKQAVLPSLEGQLQILQKINIQMNSNTDNKKILEELLEITIKRISTFQQILFLGTECVKQHNNQQQLLKILSTQQSRENTPITPSNDLKRKNATVTFFPEPLNSSKKTKPEDISETSEIPTGMQLKTSTGLNDLFPASINKGGFNTAPPNDNFFQNFSNPSFNASINENDFFETFYNPESSTSTPEDNNFLNFFDAESNLPDDEENFFDFLNPKSN